MTKQITFTALPEIPMVEPGDDVALLLLAAIKRAGIVPRENDAVVIAQKVVSKAENRYINLDDVTPTGEALLIAKTVGKDPRHIQVVLSESKSVLRTRPNVMIVEHRLGFIMANAGIDESNIAHPGGSPRVLLLPEDPSRSCEAIKRKLDAALGVSVAVVINDSFGRPWRMGVTGVAIGAAGFPCLRSMIGTPDLFGRNMKVTEVALADELAAGASLVMGQGAEGQPAVYVQGLDLHAPVNGADALIRPIHLDMFR
jgi:coenzyme F420-0:L-glutamate ligase / coenzyme F420-1:gamma-L-glutamate ligase